MFPIIGKGLGPGGKLPPWPRRESKPKAHAAMKAKEKTRNKETTIFGLLCCVMCCVIYVFVLYILITNYKRVKHGVIFLIATMEEYFSVFDYINWLHVYSYQWIHHHIANFKVQNQWKGWIFHIYIIKSWLSNHTLVYDRINYNHFIDKIIKSYDQT